MIGDNQNRQKELLLADKFSPQHVNVGCIYVHLFRNRLTDVLKTLVESREWSLDTCDPIFVTFFPNIVVKTRLRKLAF